jgi:hypothetical protein
VEEVMKAYTAIMPLQVISLQKKQTLLVVSGFAESPGFKPLVFDPGDS